jgi:hypothetical protein
MLESAPRYDDRIHTAIRTLDDRTQPMAEIARRVGWVAAELGLPKPSYVHVRRYIHFYRAEQDAEAERAREIRKVVHEIYLDALRGRVINAYEVAEQIRNASS